ncbi:hypothetical protein Fmac_032061 [Flemingia macrophylla]|uniref:Uncharacterized protein n=1 Tax=Flemingia macrophylla TaxID=520843 RepID=A0ABD1L563_9FABA
MWIDVKVNNGMNTTLMKILNSFSCAKSNVLQLFPTKEMFLVIRWKNEAL